MGEAFITRRGGSGISFAVISVTYREGSTCTCTDGTKTLKLKNTGGQDFFLVPYAGTWTVTATDGTNTKTVSVEITTEGQSESVDLSYALVIYDFEREQNPEWAVHLYANISIDSSNCLIVTSNNSNNAGSVYTKSSFDLTYFSALKIDYKSTIPDDIYNRFGVSSISSGTNQPEAYVNMPITSNRKIVELDISAITSEKYINIVTDSASGKYYTIYKIWAE